jgi:hypothetical protein
MDAYVPGLHKKHAMMPALPACALLVPSGHGVHASSELVLASPSP